MQNINNFDSTNDNLGGLNIESDMIMYPQIQMSCFISSFVLDQDEIYTDDLMSQSETVSYSEKDQEYAQMAPENYNFPTKKITKEKKRNYPSQRKPRRKFQTEAERLEAKKQQNRDNIKKWRSNQENRTKERARLNEYRTSEAFKTRNSQPNSVKNVNIQQIPVDINYDDIYDYLSVSEKLMTKKNSQPTYTVARSENLYSFDNHFKSDNEIKKQKLDDIDDDESWDIESLIVQLSQLSTSDPKTKRKTETETPNNKDWSFESEGDFDDYLQSLVSRQ